MLNSQATSYDLALRLRETTSKSGCHGCEATVIVPSWIQPSKPFAFGKGRLWMRRQDAMVNIEDQFGSHAQAVDRSQPG